MNCFKKILSIAALFVIGSLSARIASTPTSKPIAQLPATTTKPQQQPSVVQPKQPKAQPQSYAQALNIIRTMPAHKVLSNNSFTQEFINFIQSLNLSSTETKALLEAGANIHTMWTGNSEQDKQILLSQKNNIESTISRKPTPQPKPAEQQKPTQREKQKRDKREPREKKEKRVEKAKVQEPIIKLVEPVLKDVTPVKKYFATNNLIMLLDPENVEKIDGDSRAMVFDALLGMYEQAAPIILTSNILEIITSLRQKIGANNLLQLRNSTMHNVQPFAQQLINNYKLHEQYLAIILLSLINFDDKTMKCYLHTSANLVLIIPQKYIQANLLKANLSGNEQIKACGFNPKVLTPINNLAPENLLQQLQQQPKVQNQTQFMNPLTSLFIPQKKNNQLISPLDDTKWVVYMSGHGGPAYQPVQQMPGPLTQIMRVAGLTINNFKRLMQFFDEDINTAFLHYTTCFSGGYNQTFVNEILSSLDVNFIVSSEGVGERKVSGIQLNMMFSSQAPYIRLATHPFTDFFRLLRLYFSNPEEFVRIKPEKKDPMAVILKTIHADMKEENQPFVRFPGATAFGAISIAKNTKILTQTIVTAHEIEKKPIDFSATNIDVIMVNPSRINVAMNLGKIGPNEHKAIVSPTPTSMAEYHESIHVFKEINCNTTLQSLLFNFIYLNTSMNTITFIVKKLTGIQSIPGNQGQSNNINNLIIQINRQVLYAGIMTANIQISFELNGNIYQANTAVRNFDHADFVSQELKKLVFTNQPPQATDMNALASKFLKPQEINALKKPITYNALTEFINSKIDLYEPSLKGTQVQGRDLLEFTKKRINQ